MRTAQALVLVLAAAALAAAQTPAPTWREVPRRTAEFYDGDGVHGIPLRVDEPAGVERRAFPVSTGVPFPKGALTSPENVRVLDPAKREVPSQVKVLSRWLDDSVRWLLVDFQADVAAGGKATYFLEYGSKVVRAKAQPGIVVIETDQDITLDTGVLKLRVAKGRGSLIEEAWLDRNRDGRYADDEGILAEPMAAFVDIKDTGAIPTVKPDPKVEPGEINVWRFRTDPKDQGVKESWFAEAHDADGWKRLFTGYYEDQGFPGYDGYSWYRASFTVPAEYRGRDLRIAFGAIDDFGWAYLNGKLAAHNFEAGEGKTNWDVPLYAPITPLVRFDKPNVLAVRVFDPHYGGGIWRKVIVECREGEAWRPVPIVCEPIPREAEPPPLWPTHDMTGRYSIALDAEAKAEVETRDALRAVVKVSGWHRNARGDKFAMYTLRLHAFAGSDTVRVYHTFVNTGDPRRFYFQGVGLSQRLRLGRDRSLALGLPEGPLVRPSPDGTSCVLFQTNEETRKWPKFDQWKPRFRVIETAAGATREVATGEYAEGWADLADASHGCLVHVRNMWQQYPKGFEVAGDRITTWLYPPQAGPLDLRNTTQRMPDDFREFLKGMEGIFWYKPKPEDLRTAEIPWINTAVGVAKTHEVVFSFHGPDPDRVRGRAVARAFEKPSVAYVTPAWYADSLAMGAFHPFDPDNFPAVEKKLEAMIDWIIKHQTEWFRWYGMIDYGNWQYAYDAKQDRWLNYTVKTGWQSGEIEQDHAVFVQYLRTGERKYYDLAECMARHRMDIGSIHFLPGMTPETWGGGSRHNTDHWGNRMHGYAHTYPFGLRDYYWIAGYDRALDVLRSYADAQPPLNPERTMHFSRDTWHAFKIPFAAWEVTCDPKYKAKLDLARETVLRGLAFTQDPNGAIVHVQGKNPIEDWMFNEYLCTAVNAYCMFTGDEEMKRRYVGAIESLLGQASDMYCSERYAAAYLMTKNPAFAKAAAAVLNGFTGRAVALPVERGSFAHSGAICNQHSAPAYLMAAAYDARTPAAVAAKPKPIRPAAGYSFLPVSIASVANAAPLSADPFGIRQDTKPPKPESDLALKPGEIGFDMGFLSDVAKGFLPVTGAHVYPTDARQPWLAENFAGYPFGAVAEFNGAPFDLAPAHTAADKAIVVLRKGDSARIPVGATARAVHFLGHVSGLNTSRTEEGARYVIRFADGTAQEVPIKNMEHYQPFTVRVPFATATELACSLSGYRGRGAALRTLSVEVPEKQIAAIEFVESGPDHRVALVGVTLEVKAPTAAKPAFDKTLIFDAIEAYDEAKGVGWRSIEGLTLENKVVSGGRKATLSCKVPNGPYDVTVELSSRADRDSIHVDAEGVRRLTFVKTNPWLRATFPAQIEDGVLDVTFTPRTGDAPADLGRWSLKSMRVVSRSAVVPPGPPADGGIVYGWQPETTGAQSRIMFTVRYLSDHHCSSAKDRLFGDCVSATYDWGPDDITFNADLPNGRYDVECHVIQVYGGTPLILDAFAEGVPQVQKLALKDRPGGSWGPSRKIPMKAEVADGQLNLRFVISDEASKSKSYMWGIQAVIVRPAAR